MNRLIRIAILGAVLSCMTGAAAFAEGEGVLERQRPEYDAKGLPLGAFRLFPKLTVNVGHDDNVLRQDVVTTSSIVTQQKPSALLKSEWSRHSLSLFGDLTAQQFEAIPNENTLDYRVGGSGRLDIQRGSDISVGGFYFNGHEPRTSPELPGFAEKPTPFTQTHGDVAINYAPNRFGIKVGAKIDSYSYDPTQVIAPGAPINNRDRDHNEYDIFARLTYEFSPGYAIFTQADYIAHDYDLALDRNGLNRNNDGYRGNVGVSVQLSRLLQGEVYVGYLSQKFKAPLKDVSGINYGAALNWYADERLTVHLTASRTLVPTTTAGASANDNQTFGISADFELLRNVLLLAGYSHTNSDFSGIAREDKMNTIDVGAKYLMNRYMSVDVTYTYSNRNSNSPGQDYTDNLIRGGLNLHL